MKQKQSRFEGKQRVLEKRVPFRILGKHIEKEGDAVNYADYFLRFWTGTRWASPVFDA